MDYEAPIMPCGCILSQVNFMVWTAVLIALVCSNVFGNFTNTQIGLQFRQHEIIRIGCFGYGMAMLTIRNLNIEAKQQACGEMETCSVLVYGNTETDSASDGLCGYFGSLQIQLPLAIP